MTKDTPRLPSKPEALAGVGPVYECFSRLFAQCPRLIVIQNGDNVRIEETVPVECPVRQCLGTVGFTDDHAPTSCQVMPAANLFDAAAPVCCVLFSRHL